LQVISEPEITAHKLDRCDKFVILGSDGVWDRITSEVKAHAILVMLLM